MRWLQRTPTPTLPDDHAQLRAEIQALRADIAVIQSTHQTEIQALRVALEKSDRIIEALKATEAKYLGEIRELYTRIASLEQQLLDARHEREADLVERATLQAQYGMADERLKNQRRLLDEQTTQLAVLKSETEQYKGMYAGTAMAKQAVELDLQQARAEIARLQQRVTELEAAGANLKRANDEITRLQQRVLELETLVTELQQSTSSGSKERI